MIQRRALVAFDFDHTIIEDNSDIVARKLIHVDLIPEQVRKLYQSQGWTEYMAEIFKLLHKHNVSKETILDAMRRLAPTPNMLELLEWLRSVGHEIIVISDSNSVFINEWLHHRNLDESIAQVFTNPASFGENGLLSIQPYQDQDWCKLSTKNLCKGHILESYIKNQLGEGVTFDAIVYVGDGHNDFCPALKLGKNDFVFPRVGFPLETLISNATEDKVRAKIHPWTSASEIKKVLQTMC